MKRHAILIATPGSPGSGADNACVDVAEWQAFLMDLPGGAWEKDEIDTFTNPERDRLAEAMGRASECDYAVVTFSGHGKLGIHDGEPTTMVSVYAGEPAVPYFELRPRAARTLLVLDSCRWAPRTVLETFAAKRGASLVEKAVRNAYRRFFEEEVLKTERGTIILYGCGIGEESRDWYHEKRPGGLYTLALLDAAQQWVSTASNKQVRNVVDAHRVAEVEVVRRNPEQHPDIRHGRRLGVFPLAVRL